MAFEDALDARLTPFMIRGSTHSYRTPGNLGTLLTKRLDMDEVRFCICVHAFCYKRIQYEASVHEHPVGHVVETPRAELIISLRPRPGTGHLLEGSILCLHAEMLSPIISVHTQAWPGAWTPSRQSPSNAHLAKLGATTLVSLAGDRPSVHLRANTESCLYNF